MRCDEVEAIPDLVDKDTPEILAFSEIPSISCVHLNAFVLKPDGPRHLPDALCSNCFRETTRTEREEYDWKVKHFVVSHTRELSYYCDACYAPIAKVKSAEDCRNCTYVYARKLQEVLVDGHTVSNYPAEIIESSEH